MGKFISLFAGVGGFDLGMELAGHECVAQVEWDKNAAGVLKRRWPDVPLFCDVSKVSADDLPDADFITYGFPCQDLSVAGKREGLDGQRSGLFYEATRLIRELRARGCGLRIAVAENVAGLFSADDGVALARCIRELLDCGACETGWRLLDSQYFGVAQRRKRVFIVSDFGGESVDEILAVTESLPGHPAPSREAGQGTAGDAGAGFTASSFGGYERGCGTLRSQGGDLGGGSETLAVNSAFSDGSQTSSSLTTRCHDQFMPDKGNFCAVIQAQGEYQGKPLDQSVADTVCSKWSTGSGGPAGSETGNMITQSSGSDPELMSTLCAKDNDKVGSNQWINEGKALITQGADVYNGELTGETAVTVTSATGIANASGPKVIEQKETYCLQGGGETSQSGNGLGVDKDVAFTLNGLDKHGVVSWNGDTTPKASEDVSVTLRSQQGGEGVGVAHLPLTVRRLTPVECERLQGFPDGWTSEKMEVVLEGNEWKATGKVVKQADGPRYKAMGNAVTVNVAEWLGKRIGGIFL